MRPLALLLLFSLTPLLLCQPYSTGYFTNVTLYTPSSYFNNWLFPTSSYLVAYQFLGSSGTQALLPNFITSICLQIYNSTYNSSHSVQLSVPISYDQYSRWNTAWNFSSSMATVTTLLDSTVNQTYQCVYNGQITINDDTTTIYISSNDSYSSSPCYYFIAVANVPFVFPSSTVPLYVTMLYIIIITQLVCVSLLAWWNYKLIIKIRRISPVCLAFLYYYISNREVTLVNMISTGYSTMNFIVLSLINGVLYVGLGYMTLKIVYLYGFSKKSRNIFLTISTIFNIALLLSSLFVFEVNFWTYVVLPALAFLAQSVRNWLQRKTKLKIYYTFYLGIMGINMFESMYYYTLPNIYMIPTTVYNILIWCFVWIAIIVGFILQFKYLFTNKITVLEFDAEDTDRFKAFLQNADNNPNEINESKVIQHQNNVRFSKLSELKNMNLKTGKLLKNQYQDFMAQLTFEILNLKNVELREEKYGDDVPDCAICYCLLTEEAGCEGAKGRFKELVMKTDCAHHFHYMCILYYWFQAPKKECPLCRRKVDRIALDNIVRVKEAKQ